MFGSSITQVIDLMEGLRCSALPLMCERIVEVQYRDWLVAPSLKKDGTFNKRIASCEDDNEFEPSEDTEGKVFSIVLCIFYSMLNVLSLSEHYLESNVT